MRVRLPSEGVLGLKFVDLRVPTIGHYRNLNLNLTNFEGVKYDFIKSLIYDDIDVSKITRYDMEYLFLLIVAINNNYRLEVTSKCECGEQINLTLDLSNFELVTQDWSGMPYSLEFEGKKYYVRILSMADEKKALDNALVYDDFQKGYYQSLVALSLDWDFGKIEEIPVYIYNRALAIIGLTFHGVRLEAKTICKQCKKEVFRKIKLGAESILLDNEKIITMYESFSSYISFKDFLSWTKGELQVFKKAIEKRFEDNNINI